MRLFTNSTLVVQKISLYESRCVPEDKGGKGVRFYSKIVALFLRMFISLKEVKDRSGKVYFCNQKSYTKWKKKFKSSFSSESVVETKEKVYLPPLPLPFSSDLHKSLLHTLPPGHYFMVHHTARFESVNFNADSFRTFYEKQQAKDSTVPVYILALTPDPTGDSHESVPKTMKVDGKIFHTLQLKYCTTRVFGKEKKELTTTNSYHPTPIIEEFVQRSQKVDR